MGDCLLFLPTISLFWAPRFSELRTRPRPAAGPERDQRRGQGLKGSRDQECTCLCLFCDGEYGVHNTQRQQNMVDFKQQLKQELYLKYSDQNLEPDSARRIEAMKTPETN